MENLINLFTETLGNNPLFALFLAFLAGIVSSFSPCVFSTIPLIIGYVEKNDKKDKKTAFKYSLIFALGIITTFTLLGIVSAYVGKYLNFSGKWWFLFLGTLMIILSLNMMGVIGGKKAETCSIPKERKSFLGAFFLGVLGGVLSSPCSTPVLAAILAFVAGKGSILLGALMLLVYSIGHCVLIVLSGTSIGIIETLSTSPKYMKIGNILKIVFSILILLIGFYLLYMGM